MNQHLSEYARDVLATSLIGGYWDRKTLDAMTLLAGARTEAQRKIFSARIADLLDAAQKDAAA